MTVRIITGDCRQTLRNLPDASVHCCISSPPYLGLRDYGTGTWQGGDPRCDHVVGEMRRGLGLAKAAPRGGGLKLAKAEDIKARVTCPKCGGRRIDRQIGLEEVHDCLGWATGAPCGVCFICTMVGVFREVRRVLRPEGTLWVNLGDSYAGSGRGGAPTEESSTLEGSHRNQKA